MSSAKKRIIINISSFVAGLVLAVIIYVVYVKPAPTGDATSAPAAVEHPVQGQDIAIATGEMQEFLAAVTQKDFASMRSLGQRMFHSGRKVPNAGQIFIGFETTSYPPHRVYAFFTENTPGKTRRVLLTLDNGDLVTSFMAEEMAVVP